MSTYSTTETWIGYLDGEAVAEYPSRGAADAALAARTVDSVAPNRSPFGTHYLRVAVTQGVDGPAHPPVLFRAGTRVRAVAGLGDTLYVEARHPDLTDGIATLVVRPEQVAEVPAMPPMSTRYPTVAL
jgi:hypothetical protein